MLKIIYTSIIFTTAVALQIFSQTINWQQLHAPVASSITGITQLSNGEFYVSTRPGGIYKSTDNGSSWMECNAGISYLNINEIYSTDDNKLFACSGAGIFQFNWQAQEWVNLNAPQADYVSITVNSLGHIIAGSNFGIFRSEDGGNTWQTATTYISTVYSLITGINNILFAGTTLGIYKSMDNGNTWTIAGLEGIYVSDMTIDYADNIYANVFYRGEGIYRSQNQGVTWEQINLGLSNQLTTTIAVDFQGDIYVGAFEGGVFQKASGQPSFTQINIHQSMSQVLSIYVTQDNILYICSELGGLFRRNDLNLEWEQVNSGLLMNHAIPLGFDSADILYMGNLNAGIYRSADMGESWYPVAPYLGGSHLFTFLAYDNSLYLGTTIEFAFWGMLFKSIDQGESWDYFHQGLPLIHPDYPWIQVILAMDINSYGDLFAALNTGGVYRRANNSTNWNIVSIGIPDSNVFSLCINSNDIVFAGFGDGRIYKSDAAGENWSESLSGFEDYSVNILKSSENYVFAIMHNFNYPKQDSSLGVYSADNGDSWYNLKVNALGSRVTSIDCDLNNNIFVGTDSNGVFVSTDYGEHWIPVNSDLTDLSITRLFIHPNGFAICGTASKGLFKGIINTTTHLPDTNRSTLSFALHQNYPNPFNSETTIKYNLKNAIYVDLVIFNSLGQKVKNLISAYKTARNHSVKWDGTNNFGNKLSSGIYYYRITTKEFTSINKMILIK